MEALLSESSADESESRNQFLIFMKLIYTHCAAAEKRKRILHRFLDPGYSWNVNGICLEVGLQFLATVSLVLVFSMFSFQGWRIFSQLLAVPQGGFMNMENRMPCSHHAFFSVAGIVADSCDQPR